MDKIFEDGNEKASYRLEHRDRRFFLVAEHSLDDHGYVYGTLRKSAEISRDQLENILITLCNFGTVNLEEVLSVRSEEVAKFAAEQEPARDYEAKASIQITRESGRYKIKVEFDEQDVAKCLDCGKSIIKSRAYHKKRGDFCDSTCFNCYDEGELAVSSSSKTSVQTG